jgi:hypothetical protein
MACPITHQSAVPFVAQLRFLPALSHASRTRKDDFLLGKLKWLIQIDDDSSVNIPRLLLVLGRHDDTEPLHLGDFVETWENETHWVQPYACGGAGTIFSRGAMTRIGFDTCVNTFAGACLQSDWMIARCAATYGVVQLRKWGCQCRGMSGAKNDKMAKYLLASSAVQDGACTFMHVTTRNDTDTLSTWNATVETWRARFARRNAIIHSSPANSLWLLLHAKQVALASASGRLRGAGGHFRSEGQTM